MQGADLKYSKRILILMSSCTQDDVFHLCVTSKDGRQTAKKKKKIWRGGVRFFPKFDFSTYTLASRL